MKKLSLLLILAMSTLFAMAQNGRIDLRSTSRAEITKSEFSKFSAVFSYGSIESVEVSTERGTFSEIAIEGTYISGEIGAPQLPASHQLLAVPFGATPSVMVKNYSYTDYDLASYGISTKRWPGENVSSDNILVCNGKVTVSGSVSDGANVNLPPYSSVVFELN